MLAFDEPLDWMAVSHWLAYLRSARGEDLLRVKGILNLHGEQTPVVIHGVHHVFHPPVALPEWPDADRRSRIVFITRGIAREEVLALWQAGRAAAERSAIRCGILPMPVVALSGASSRLEVFPLKIAGPRIQPRSFS